MSYMVYALYNNEESNIKYIGYTSKNLTTRLN